MDISRQLKQAENIFIDDGFIPVLKEMAIALMSTVKVNYITSEKLPNAGGANNQ